MRMKRTLLFLSGLVGTICFIQFLGPNIKASTPHAAHSWLGNFGAGLLIATLGTAAWRAYRSESASSAWTPVRLAVAVIGVILLFVYQSDGICQVKGSGKTLRVVCEE
jgi:uncharacterized membrane protein